MSDLLTPPDLYPRAYTLDGKLKHSKECLALFKRRDWRCPRCCELLRDAAPRTGWQKRYFEQKVGQKRFTW